MENPTFQSNSKCGGSVATCDSSLYAAVASDHWYIDLTTPDRVLTITCDLSDDDIVRLVTAAGFKAEKIG